MQIDYSFARNLVREGKAKLFLGLFSLILGLIPLSARGQGVSVQGQAVVNTTTSVSGIPGNSILQAVPNPTITICSSAGGGIPCTPTVTIYNCVAVNAGCIAPNPLPICAPAAPVLGCVDANGNFQFFVQPNATGYLYSQTASGITGQLFTISPQSSGPLTLTGNIVPSTAGISLLGTCPIPFLSLSVGSAAGTATTFATQATACRTATFPDASNLVSLATIEYCGATSGATQACAKTVQTIPIIVWGDVLLNGAATQSITTLPFTDATYSCSGSDATTTAGIVFFNTYTAASVTIGENGGANTDHLRWLCIGH